MKGDSVETDELVKHMTHLPDYLRQAKRKETLQEEALNVGVLDWSRLEKFTQKTIALNVMSLPGTDDIPTTAVDCHDEKISKTNKLSSRSYRGIAPTKSRHHRASSELGVSLSNVRPLRDTDDGTTASANIMHHAKTDSFKAEVTSLPKIGRKQGSASVMEKGMMDDEGITKRGINWQASNENAVKRHCSSKQSSKVLLPRMNWDVSSLEVSHRGDRMKMSSENSTETCLDCFSSTYSEEFYSVDCMGECRITDKIPKRRDDTSQERKSGNKLPEGEIPKKNVSNGGHCTLEDSSKGERFHAVDEEIGEVSDQKGQPIRKFSLSGITRSFCYKERTSASTIISGRSKSKTTDDLFLTKGKQKISAKSRFSPFRRLLHPILKYKPVTSNSCVEDAQSHLNSSIHSSILSDKCVGTYGPRDSPLRLKK